MKQRTRGSRRCTRHLTKKRRIPGPDAGRDNHSSATAKEEKGKKKPATKRCGLESNFLRRRLEETGATIVILAHHVCFIVAIADIHKKNI
ncbi:hypothetical protein G5B88_09660 [Herbaspirillum seropedicae]|uniref:hypothetical protein n=1 Tax=Herbaspirillum seropedicae TaxID=964 RepID=UPI0012E1BDB4|nr:hypothetical protein [Herbaspirillum seropedicae]UMU21428.1 hypothetical protein G5B88_09660 [Herbaspirillum seropedicae]